MKAARKLTLAQPLAQPRNNNAAQLDQGLADDLLSHKVPVGVVGLGYVGLPLACHLAKTFRVTGLDINAGRVKELQDGTDRTNEVHEPHLLKQKSLSFTTDASALSECRVVIVAVPTPVDEFHKPDLSPLVMASQSIAKVLKPGTTIVFESTVYPGATEGPCREVLEKSGLVYNKEFFLGYSPERINPGDRLHTPDRIIKIVSGSTPETLELLAWLYSKMTSAGVHRAESIQVAEATKIMENIQRDVNIALVNELTMLFDSLKIPMHQVIAAAKTKWNFLNFYPGLVGGHCIGVDPYYIVHLAEKQNFPVSVVSSSRNVNEAMPRFLAVKTISKIMSTTNLSTTTPLKIGILGAAFKDNVSDTRNTKVADLARELERFGCEVFIVDELADADSFSHEYQREISSFESLPRCHAMVIAVRHEAFAKNYSGERIKSKMMDPYVLVDLKAMVSEDEAEMLGLKLCKI